MTSSNDASRDLLFGLLALQNGLINQSQLVAAFQTWTLAKDRCLADHFVARRDLDADDVIAIGALVEHHIKKHFGDVEQSLAAVPAGPSTREKLARLGDQEIDATLARVGPRFIDDDPDHTADYSFGTPTSDGERFRVLRPHARGGLGAVFVALDNELHREVALKQILDQHADDPTSRQRFILEAEVTGGLEHPGIVPVYGLGTYGDGRPFYTMRFVRGDSLKVAVDTFHADVTLASDPGRRSLELRELLRRFTDVCNAVAYAHSRGVLHRDLKPGNIIVGKHGETLVVDWGLAKAMGRMEPGSESGERTLTPSLALGDSETLPGSALGTPAYMSPEQAEGDLDRVGPASDVYSLGATLYYLLTGRPPFDGDAAELILAARKGALRRPCQLDRSIHPALEAVCLKAMAHRPADRYAAPKALAEDLERWMADEPVAAYAEPVAIRARRWVRRHPRLVTGSMVSVVGTAAALMAITVVVSTWNGRLSNANRTIHRNSEVIAARNQELEQSRQELARARGEAMQERDQAREVTAFLVSTFRKPDPEMDGRDVKVAQVLKDAAKVLDGRTSIAPLTRAAILSAIGETYSGLGLASEAAEMFERALSLRQQMLGADHLETVATIDSLASAWWMAGQYDRAIRLSEQVLEVRRSKLGTDHPLTLTAMNDLAVCYEDSGRLDRAIDLFRQTLEAHRKNLGENHLETVLVMHNLADTYLIAGQPDRAVPMLEKAVAVYRATKGAHDPATLEMINNLARAYGAIGDQARALALHEEVFLARTAKLGPDHHLTLTSTNNVAVTYLAMDQASRAIPLLEQVLARRRSQPGVQHPSIFGTMSNLARAYQDTSQLDRAITLYEEALAGQQSSLGASHFITLTTQSNLARAYEAARRLPDAERQFRRVIETAGRNQPRNDRFWSESLARLGDCLIRQNRHADAIPILRQSLEIQMKIQPNEWSTAVSQGLLGEALVGEKALAEAEPLLLASQKALSQMSDKIPPRRLGLALSAACDRLISLYEAWDKRTEAERWRHQRPR